MDFGYKKLYIDGQLVDASNGAIFDVISPSNEQKVGTIAWAAKENTQKALETAQAGFQTWSVLPLENRLAWIDKLRTKLIENTDLLQNSVMYEMGKTWEGSEEDITSIVKSLAFYSEEIKSRNTIEIEDKEGTHQHQIVSQPLGVVVAFLAYNFPLLNLGFKLGPALAAGCSIIIKPSEFSPLSAHIIGGICEEINFPKGVITIISGDLHNVGIPLCESTIPKLITMIGSTETAQKLIEQSCRTSIKRYSMECGGNAPFIVFPDANMEVAVNVGAALKIGNSGQICVAPNRFFIHESVIEDFSNGLLKKFQNVKIGFGKENQPNMGPLANKVARENVDRLVKEALSQGGELIIGGKYYGEKGYYYEPTLIRLKDKNAPILQKEFFGPVAILIPFSTEEEVLQLANNTEAGLASYVFSADEGKLKYFSENLEFGEVQLNGVKYDIYLPHGGIKNSGIGVDCSSYALDDYLIKKRVTRTLQ
jgi:succinate-semialdehyde dehydrogenase/glutarate-semialdehyde dehydrogenase